MKITFLGTGSAVPTAKRDNTSILFEWEDKNLLADCSGSPFHKMLRAGFTPARLQSVFITHNHPDHIYGLPSLIHSLNPSGYFPEIYVPNEMVDKIRSFLGLFCLEEKAKLTGCYTKIPNSKINLLKTRHSRDSRGFIINFQDKKKIIYTSDTGPIENGPDIFKDADCLIHDCSAPQKFKKKFNCLDKTHTSAERLGRIAQEANVKLLVPVHFSGELYFTDREIKNSITRFYSGNLFIPKDLDTINI